jgi:hypothetical protein
MELGRGCGKAEVTEDALDGGRRGQRRYDLHAPFAPRTLEDVLEEDAPR